MSAGSPLLEIVDLHVAYGRLEVVHGISLTVAPGAFTVLLGRNGAGKTTTLRAVSGLLRKRAGEVRFGGGRVASLRQERAPVPQEPRFPDEIAFSA